MSTFQVRRRVACLDGVFDECGLGSGYTNRTPSEGLQPSTRHGFNHYAREPRHAVWPCAGNGGAVYNGCNVHLAAAVPIAAKVCVSEQALGGIVRE